MGALSAFSIVCCVWGIAISVYALHVERSHEKNVNYQAMCDIAPRISCSKVLTSKYSRGLGLVGPLLGEDHPLNVPNAIAGIVYYTIMMFLSCCPLAGISLLLSLMATAASIYLSFILIFILSDLCVVCLAVYVVNSALLAASYAAWRKPRKPHKEYSRGLGLVGPLLGEDHPLNVPNAIGGIVYYTIMMFLSEIHLKQFSKICGLLLSLAATIAGIYPSYTLIFIMSDLCVICLAAYVINCALLVTSYAAWEETDQITQRVNHYWKII